jgi:hypothetical protein
LFTGSQAEAIAIAIQANVKHGKPLSREERRAAARILLHSFPERSDRWVGETCGLSHATVALIRRGLNISNDKVRTGRDGRRRPVDKLASQMAVARLLTDNPATTVRQIARAAGVAPSTVHRARARLQGLEVSSAPSAPVRLPTRSVDKVDLPHPPLGSTPDLPISEGVAFEPAASELAEPASWLARTSVNVEDVRTYLGALPLSRLYGVVDECRKRAQIWADIATALEGRARGGLASKRCLKA